jgi:hypothetical protein
MKLESLDFLYMPSADPAAEIDYFESVLGAKVAFRIEAFGTRVGMVRMVDGPPALLFAGHLQGDRPILVYRVASLDDAVAELEAEGGTVSHEFGIPHGPVREVELPGGHRMAIYELTRPETAEHLEGRRDF